MKRYPIINMGNGRCLGRSDTMKGAREIVRHHIAAGELPKQQRGFDLPMLVRFDDGSQEFQVPADIES